jgi:hypothetical protein
LNHLADFEPALELYRLSTIKNYAPQQGQFAPGGAFIDQER